MIIKGISVSKSFCIGKIFVKHKNNDINSLKMNISKEEVHLEVDKFRRVIEITKLEFQNLYKEFYNDFDNNIQIFFLHILLSLKILFL